MSDKKLFESAAGKSVVTDTENRAGGKAYAMNEKHELAQYAVTGTFNTTFYARSAQSELDRVIDLVKKVGAKDPEFIARLAVYARTTGFMKDTPAFMVAYLATVNVELMAKVFPLVINNGKMLRNFVQILRSGQLGRKSLGSAPKRAVLNWLKNRSDDQVFFASIGSDPSLVDIIKMVHPKPEGNSREALYGYLLGKEHNVEALPKVVQEFEAFKKGEANTVPNLPWQFLTGLTLKPEHWKQIARDMRWLATIKNLNTFQRQGVLNDSELVDLIAKRIADVGAIQKANVLPYQVMAAYVHSKSEIDRKIVHALHDAMENAVQNVPSFKGNTLIAIDTSASMGTPVTGQRGTATSVMTCRDVAALFGASVLRRNPLAKVITVDTSLHEPKVSGRDTILTTASAIMRNGGGTNLSLVADFLHNSKETFDNIIMVSDNESWADDRGWARGTCLADGFAKYVKTRNNKAKMVCIDIVANETTQVKNKPSTLNVGGFNDTVFTVVSQFFKSGSTGEEFVKTIENVSLD